MRTGSGGPPTRVLRHLALKHFAPRPNPPLASCPGAISCLQERFGRTYLNSLHLAGVLTTYSFKPKPPLGPALEGQRGGELLPPSPPLEVCSRAGVSKWQGGLPPINLWRMETLGEVGSLLLHHLWGFPLVRAGTPGCTPENICCPCVCACTCGPQ